MGIRLSVAQPSFTSSRAFGRTGRGERLSGCSLRAADGFWYEQPMCRGAADVSLAWKYLELLGIGKPGCYRGPAAKLVFATWMSWIAGHLIPALSMNLERDGREDATSTSPAEAGRPVVPTSLLAP